MRKKDHRILEKKATTIQGVDSGSVSEGTRVKNQLDGNMLIVTL